MATPPTAGGTRRGARPDTAAQRPARHEAATHRSGLLPAISWSPPVPETITGHSTNLGPSTQCAEQALQSVKVRNLYRMLYRDVQCMVRTKSANGETAYSHPYHPTRGGCQGSVWMPFLFLILAHYTYKRVDPGRSQIYGASPRVGITVPGQGASSVTGADANDPNSFRP